MCSSTATPPVLTRRSPTAQLGRTASSVYMHPIFIPLGRSMGTTMPTKTATEAMDVRCNCSGKRRSLMAHSRRTLRPRSSHPACKHRHNRRVRAHHGTETLHQLNRLRRCPLHHYQTATTRQMTAMLTRLTKAETRALRTASEGADPAPAVMGVGVRSAAGSVVDM